jgi:hypothetical protein
MDKMNVRETIRTAGKYSVGYEMYRKGMYK